MHGVPTDEWNPIDKGGKGAFWRDVRRYNQVATTGLVLGLADLEGLPCPSGLICTNLPHGRHANFLLRIAEPMLEGWLLGDAAKLSEFLGISKALVPRNPEAESHPKQTLVNLARKSPLRDIRADLVPEKGSLGIVGKGYRPRMTEFIETAWRALEARRRCQSLDRALRAIAQAVGVGLPVVGRSSLGLQSPTTEED